MFGCMLHGYIRLVTCSADVSLVIALLCSAVTSYSNVYWLLLKILCAIALCV